MRAKPSYLKLNNEKNLKNLKKAIKIQLKDRREYVPLLVPAALALK